MPGNGKANGSESARPRWYYDACTLDRSKSSYAEMFNNRHRPRAVISHLSFGEAYANSHLKGPEQADAFVKLMNSLSQYIEVVGNDGCDLIFSRVREIFPRLSLTDAIHIATAIGNHCVIIRTTDQDMHGLSRTGLNDLAKEFSLPGLSITQMS